MRPAPEWSLCTITVCILFCCVWRGKVMADGCFSVNSDKLPNLGKQEALWHLAARLSLFVTDAAVTHLHFSSSSSPSPPHRCPLAQNHPSSPPFSLLIPKSQTLTGGGDAFSRQSPPPPFRACSQTEGAPTGLPVNFLLRGLIQYYTALGDGVNFSSV